MVKKKVNKPHREVTKRQLSRWQQQKRRQRIILGTGIFIIVAVLGVVLGGWYISSYQPLHQIVIKVNNTEFNMNYYIKMLKLNYMYNLTGDMVTLIEQNELIRQGAMELGISVSDDAVDEKLKSYDPPLSKDYRDIARTDLLISQLLDEHFEQQVPRFAEQRHIMAMFLESESQAIEVRARLEGGESFTELAGELSLDGFSKDNKGDLGWQLEGILAELLISSIPEEYAFESEVGILSQPIPDEERFKNMGYWLIEVLEGKEESEEAHIRAILLGSEEEAQEVIARLEAGEDFADLAKELSHHDASKESGGDLDWLTPDMVSEDFVEFIFNPEVELETLSEPIRDETTWTRGGYWLIQVVDEEDDREIEDEDRGSLKSKAFDEWVSALWDNAEIDDSYLDDDKRMWAIEKAMGG